MHILIMPLIFISLVITLVSFLAMKKSRQSRVDGRSEISEVIEEHPFTLNPMLWVIAIATVFIGFVIVYHATSFS